MGDGRRSAKRRAGILDVAAGAGVSRQTVTRAMNDMPGISAATKQRVLEVARELNYRPSRFGRGLVTRGTPTLGLVVVDLTNGFWGELASCVLDEAASRGWTVLIAESSHDARAALPKLLEHVDAVFGLIDLPERELAELFGAVPLVLLDAGTETDRHAGISLDFGRAMDDAVSHLISRGRRRIAMLDWSRTNQQSRRASHFVAAVERHGLEPLVLHAAVSTEPVMTSGRAAASLALERWPDLDAFVCFNDSVAVGAMKTVQAAGMDVPKDFSILGIDGSALGLIVTPELSTLRFDLRELARVAINAVIALQDGELEVGSAARTVVLPTLTIRGSS